MQELCRALVLVVFLQTYVLYATTLGWDGPTRIWSATWHASCGDTACAWTPPSHTAYLSDAIIHVAPVLMVGLPSLESLWWTSWCAALIVGAWYVGVVGRGKIPRLYLQPTPEEAEAEADGGSSLMLATDRMVTVFLPILTVVLCTASIVHLCVGSGQR
jgi:hypothetical protein